MRVQHTPLLVGMFVAVALPFKPQARTTTIHIRARQERPTLDPITRPTLDPITRPTLDPVPRPTIPDLDGDDSATTKTTTSRSNTQTTNQGLIVTIFVGTGLAPSEATARATFASGPGVAEPAGQGGQQNSEVLALGLGVGLGVGIPLLLVLGAIAFVLRRRSDPRRTLPFVGDEGPKPEIDGQPVHQQQHPLPIELQNMPPQQQHLDYQHTGASYFQGQGQVPPSMRASTTSPSQYEMGGDGILPELYARNMTPPPEYSEASSQPPIAGPPSIAPRFHGVPHRWPQPLLGPDNCPYASSESDDQTSDQAQTAVAQLDTAATFDPDMEIDDVFDEPGLEGSSDPEDRVEITLIQKRMTAPAASEAPATDGASKAASVSFCPCCLLFSP
ncbi:hypothetical protein B0H63DRAFT_516585 [Podospora didyma]|uniref:Mid2 domain-containing protein n=1 Tax=Podospora didyma TaxID=330526 RepID=A0AAE0P4M9_9PEZI|nr:hypothetical protein B0H63DRAFT_516585 [Podospora didyma]